SGLRDATRQPFHSGTAFSFLPTVNRAMSAVCRKATNPGLADLPGVRVLLQAAVPGPINRLRYFFIYQS
ncbi:MAG: hypothetical protein WBN86_09740, partial [Porticoccaceae bacterium]